MKHQRQPRVARPATRYQNGKPGDVAENGKHEQLNGDEQSVGRVDLSKLKVVSLRKYTRVYDLNGVSSSATKEELCSAVIKHFFTQNIDESEVLFNLAMRKKEPVQRGA